MTSSQSNPENTSASSPILIVAAWLVVLIPTIWGFSYTAQNAMKIFDRPSAPAATTPAK